MDESGIIEPGAAPAAPWAAAWDFLALGGPAIWAIAALSVLCLAVILWKVWRLARLGAWSRRRARVALTVLAAGRPAEAEAVLAKREDARSRLVRSAMAARAALPEPQAREEVERAARAELAVSAFSALSSA